MHCRVVPFVVLIVYRVVVVPRMVLEPNRSHYECDYNLSLFVDCTEISLNIQTTRYSDIHIQPNYHPLVEPGENTEIFEELRELFGKHFFLLLLLLHILLELFIHATIPHSYPVVVETASQRHKKNLHVDDDDDKVHL